MRAPGRATRAADVRVRIIGSDALAERYATALAHGTASTWIVAPPDAAARGLWRIARPGRTSALTKPMTKLARFSISPLPLIAVLRGITPEEIPAVAGALADEGFRVLEVPLNSPRPFESIRLLARQFGDRCLVGAGTVIAPADVARVRDAGGKLIVMPHADTAVVREAKGSGMVCVPGVATPTEAFAALAAGADGLKMFPAEALPPGALKAWRAVLPRETLGVRRRRHSARQHGAVLGGGRVRLRHRLESVRAGRAIPRRCAPPRRRTRRRCSRAAGAIERGHRRARRAADRVQPGARGRSAHLPAGLRRRHVEHGDRRGAARRARRLRHARRRRRLRPDVRATCGAREGVDTERRRDRCRGADRRLLRHARRAGPRVLAICARARRRAACAPATLPLRRDPRRRGSLHVSGISQAISAIACDAVFAAIDEARGAGALVTYDPNLRLKLWPLPRARAIIAGDDGALRLVPAEPGRRAGAVRRRRRRDAIIDACHRAGAPGVVLKLRRRRLRRLRRRTPRAHRRAPRRAAWTRPAPATASTARSPRGSLAGDDPFAAARYANVAAALATTGYGAVAPLPRDARRARAARDAARRDDRTRERVDVSATICSPARSRWSSAERRGIGAGIADAFAGLGAVVTVTGATRAEARRRARAPSFRCRDAVRARRARRRGDPRAGRRPAAARRAGQLRRASSAAATSTTSTCSPTCSRST